MVAALTFLSKIIVMPSFRFATIYLLLDWILVSGARGFENQSLIYIGNYSPLQINIRDVQPDATKLVKFEFHDVRFQLLFTSVPNWTSDIGRWIWLGRCHLAFANSTNDTSEHIAVGTFHDDHFEGSIDFDNDTLHVQPARYYLGGSTKIDCLGYLSSKLVTCPPNTASECALKHHAHLRFIQLEWWNETCVSHLGLKKHLTDGNLQHMRVCQKIVPNPLNLHLTNQPLTITRGPITNLIVASGRPTRAAVRPKEIRDHVLPCQICPYAKLTTTEAPTIYPSLPEIEATPKASTFRPPFPLPNMLGPPLPYPLKPQFVERLTFSPDLLSPAPGEYQLPPTTQPGCQCDMCKCPTSPSIIVKVRPCCCPAEDENPPLTCCCPQQTQPCPCKMSTYWDKVSRPPSMSQRRIYARQLKNAPTYTKVHVPPSAAIKVIPGMLKVPPKLASLSIWEAQHKAAAKSHIHPRSSECDTVCRPCLPHCLCDRPDLPTIIFPQLTRRPKVLPFPLQQMYALSSSNYQTYTTECVSASTESSTIAMDAIDFNNVKMEFAPYSLSSSNFQTCTTESISTSAESSIIAIIDTTGNFSNTKMGSYANNKIRIDRAELDSKLSNLISNGIYNAISSVNKSIEPANSNIGQLAPFVGQLILDSINTQIKSAYPHLFTRESTNLSPANKRRLQKSKHESNSETVMNKSSQLLWNKIRSGTTNPKASSDHSQQFFGNADSNVSIPVIVLPSQSNNMFLLRLNPELEAQLIRANLHQQFLPNSQLPNANSQLPSANNAMANSNPQIPNSIFEITNTILKDPNAIRSMSKVTQARNANLMMLMPSSIYQIPNPNVKVLDVNMSMSGYSTPLNNVNLYITNFKPHIPPEGSPTHSPSNFQTVNHRQ